MTQPASTVSTHTPRRRLLGAALGVALGAVCAVSTPQAWAQASNSTVKLIVGYAAGGPVDASARVFAPVLSRELGQPVICLLYTS